MQRSIFISIVSVLVMCVVWSCDDSSTKLHHVYIVADTYKVAPGDTVQLHLLAYPENASTGFPDAEIVWSSSDTTVATVSESGLLIARKFGIITVSVEYGRLTASRDITVSTEAGVEDEVLLEFLLERFDTDGDGVLEGYETAATAGLDLTDLNKETSEYVSMKGLEDFVNLQTLRIERLSVKDLDLSGFSYLTELYMEACNIDTIDLRWNNNITDVRVFACPTLKAVIFGSYAEYGANNLRTLHCSRNDVEEFDLSRCGATLWDIDCSENEGLAKLDLTVDTVVHTVKYSCNVTTLVLPETTDLDYLILECVE